MPSTTDLLKAALADRYRIDREIGQGGMATVYLAEDLKHHRKVAVKVLRPEIAATLGSDRFFREIEVAAQLQHPHILPLLDSGEAQNFYYYVMPFVAGESLRERLAKVGELPIHDAVKILCEVVDALAAAHAMGVVHRDIKPDNVMLSGRHALVTDFGVAKAVSEATGRNQLTTAGIALGTPAYMAPEQAAADPHLDQRVDIYAVGAMGYELLTGKPPFTGGTPSEVLGAQVTRVPEPVTAHRAACPPILGAIIMRCLEKRPSDRWQTAEELLAQLEPLATPSGGVTPTQTRPVEATGAIARPTPLSRMIVAGTLVAFLTGVALLLLNRRAQVAPVTLRDRVQLTSTGRVSYPAISPDGRQLAYAITQCDSTCHYAVEIKDVGGSPTRRIVEGATALYGIIWSPDRRNLLFQGTMAAGYGWYLVSALGGIPRLVTSGDAAFWGRGDSLLLTPVPKSDSVHWIGIAGLDGTWHDSIRVAGASQALFVSGGATGSPWVLVSLWNGNWSEYRSIDRQGQISDRVVVHDVGEETRVSADALWQVQSPPGMNVRQLIVRIPFTPKTGRFAQRWDTVYAGRFTQFDVTEDGGTLVLDEGTSEYTGWTLDLRDALRGVFPENRRLLQSTVPIVLGLSRDGNRVVIKRDDSETSGGGILSVMPFGGGPETPLKVSGTLLGWGWLDSVTMSLGEKVSGVVQFSLIDVRSGERRNRFTLADSAILGGTPLSEHGWAWLPVDGRSINVQQGDSTPRIFPVPDWYQTVFSIRSSPEGNELAFAGWNTTTFDSVRLSVLSLADGKVTPWATWFCEGTLAFWVPDGTLGVQVLESQHSIAIYHVLAPGRVERMGKIPRRIQPGSAISADLRRIVLVTMESHGDAWMSTVVRH
jgi:tRNA A-37 threonylcarbamoyl transferase component Bud32